MVRGFVRLILIVIVIVAVTAFVFGYRWGGGRPTTAVEPPVGTSGAADDVDTSRAREAGAEIGEKVAVGANQAQRALEDASLTVKIKSKMALDDTVDAIRIDVDTQGSVVTLNGSVPSAAAKSKAVQLARETEGVTSVIDRLRIE